MSKFTDLARLNIPADKRATLEPQSIAIDMGVTPDFALLEIRAIAEHVTLMVPVEIYDIPRVSVGYRVSRAPWVDALNEKEVKGRRVDPPKLPAPSLPPAVADAERHSTPRPGDPDYPRALPPARPPEEK